LALSYTLHNINKNNTLKSTNYFQKSGRGPRRLPAHPKLALRRKDRCPKKKRKKDGLEQKKKNPPLELSPRYSNAVSFRTI
jgi:hypothetical protein|tara:strand:- start:541 stop:783 length:243 start_codon:yes stop_codon:yes gene_type:complete